MPENKISKKRRSYSFKKGHVMKIAERIEKLKPPKEIIYNSLRDLYEEATNYSYMRCVEDFKFRRNKNRKNMDESFNQFMDQVDDLIHDKK